MGFMPNRANIVALAVAAATTLVAPVRAQEANDNGAPPTTAPANGAATGLGGFFNKLGEALSGAAGQIKQGIEQGAQQATGGKGFGEALKDGVMANLGVGGAAQAANTPYLPPGGTAPGQSTSFSPANGGKTAVYDVSPNGSIFVTGVSNYSMDKRNPQPGSHLCTIFAKVVSYDQSKGLPQDGSFRPDLTLAAGTDGAPRLWTREDTSAYVATEKCKSYVLDYQQAALAALRKPAAGGTAPTAAAAKKRPKKAPAGNNPG